MGLASIALYMGLFALLLRLMPPIPSQLVITLFVAGLSYLISKYWVYAIQPVTGGSGETI